MKEKIKIYAPCDGVIHSIEKLNDGVFSEKMLGDGLYIIPSSEQFYSPVEDVKLSLITESKHAFYLSDEDDINILMHIGIDTVKLNGSCFKVFGKLNQKVTHKTKLVEVDLNKIKENNLSSATPILLDNTANPGWKFKIKKENLTVKQGEEIGEFYYTNSLNVKEDNDLDFLNDKSHYQKIAEDIYYAIGGKKNYTEVFSCMTRLRLEINDDSLVDLNKIKNLSIVKGTNWSGSQLQIIIGGEVYKVLDAFKVFVNNLDRESQPAHKIVKKTFGKKVTSAISGVIMPALPLILASGLLMGIKSILVMTGAVQDMGIGTGPINTDVDAFSLFINILAETGLKLFGIYIGYNTCKYLGGNTTLQLFIGLAISGATLGMSVTQWEFFSIGNFPIKIGIYTSSILPHIAAAIILFHTEKWIKSWMPTSIDIIFRALFAMTITFGAIFFLVGPLLFILESGIGWVIGKVALVPFGIGTGLFALIWQPLVLTGMHVTVVMPIVVTNAQGFHTTLLIAMNIATFGQMGAAIGVIIRTKNTQLRTAGLSALPGALVGVTEPVIYGINLPKFRPFLSAILASAAAGWIAGVLAVEARLPGGMGIFGFTTTLAPPRLVSETINGILVDPSSKNVFTGVANSASLNLGLWFLVNFAGIGFGILFSLISYKERPMEAKQIDFINKKLIKYYSLSLGVKNSEELKKLEEQLETLKKYVSKNDLLQIKALETELVKLSKLDGKLEILISQQERLKEKYIVILKKQTSKAEEKINQGVVEKYKAKYFKIKNDESRIILQNQVKEQRELIQTQLEWLNQWQQQFLKMSESIINDVVLQTKLKEFKNMQAYYFNAIHSLDINYQITEKDDKNLSTKDINLAKNNLATLN